MMSIAFHDLQRDVVSRNPLVGNDIFRHGSDNHANAIFSYCINSFVNSSDLASSKLFHHPCLAVTIMPCCDQLPILPNSLVSYSAVHVQRHLSHQMTGPSHINKPASDISCTNNMLPSTSHLSEPYRSIQLFIKSIRNTTISIHIDSTSTISDLKHLIYAHDGISPCDLRLLHRGRELRDDALLSGLDVDGATITCLLRVLGGNLHDCIPLRWWFGFSRSYEDGRAGEEGRICHVLSDFEFDGDCHRNWYSVSPLSDWTGISLHPGIMLVDRLYFSR